MPTSSQTLAPLVLVSHRLCPNVQRAAILLAETGVPFERRDIDLAAKPDWFLVISPPGKTPVLLVGEQPIFEFAVICEYLDEVSLRRLHPANALQWARHRSWMAFGSQVLDPSLWDGLPRLQAWRSALAARPSVRAAVSAGYPELLRAFVRQRGAALGRRFEAVAA